MELSSMIEIMNRRITELDLPVEPVASESDHLGLGLAFFELVKSCPDSSDGEPSAEDVALLKAVNKHLFTLFSEQNEPNPNAVEQLVRAMELVWGKLSYEVGNQIQDDCYSGSNDLVNLWIKGAQGMGEESYGYLLEIYQWLRDELDDEEWAEEFRDENEIDEDDW